MVRKNYTVTDDAMAVCTEVQVTTEPVCPPSPSISQQPQKSKKANNQKELLHSKSSSSSKRKPKTIQKEIKGMKKKVFGYELVLDLQDCDRSVMSSAKKLQEYVDTLCKLIKMKKYGKCLLPYFGEKKAFTKGYSLVQLIETSSITGHFSEYWGTSYINIFSCKAYDHNLAKKFTKEFFGAKKVKARFLVR